jgi:23S rRNA-/tRNA-specific pseudouridylate synthase
VGKIYRARVPNPVAPGTYVHYQADVERGPRPVSSSARPGWKRCELEVLDCRESEEDFELTIRLVTGRTHQIRCQLAALGSPIVGDSLYGSDRRFGDGASEAFALACIELRLPDGGIYLKR